MRLVYLTLEAPREGQASYTHVHEMIGGLKTRGWDIQLYQPPYTRQPVSPHLLMRLVLCMGLQIRLWLGWRRGAIIYVRGHYLAFPTAVLARILNVPIFHEINGPYEDVFISHPGLNRVRPVLIWMQRVQYRWATGLVAVTDELCRWAMQESGGVACQLISNGANTALFHPDAPSPPGVPERYVVFFGGLARWHGIPLMLDAINHPDWPDAVHLVVIGDGQCSALVHDAALRNPKIHAVGRVTYRNIPPYVAHAMAGLVPISNPGRRSETGLLPLKLFETLACGVPAIVTDFPGQADLVRGAACGLVVPPDDAGALARAVATLAGDAAIVQTMGRRGRALVVADHSWDARAAQTDAMLRARRA